MLLLQNIKSNYLLLLILVLGAFLRIYNIDFQSVWLDEIHTLNEANPVYNWTEFHQALMMSDPHPPLYFAVTKILFGWFGHTAFVVRMFSAVVAIISIYIIYLFGKEIKNKQAGLLAAALLAVNYFHIYYAQEARMYAMLFMFTLWSFYRLVLFIKEPSTKNALLFGIFTGLMMQSHFFALFVLMAQSVIALIYLIKADKKARVTLFVKFLVSGLVVVLFFLPAIYLFIKTTQIQSFWIQPTTIETIKQIFKDFFFNSNLLLVFIEICIAICLFFIFKNKQNKKEREIVLFVLIPWFVLVLLIPVIRSYLSVPMIISRYFITILPPMIILAALGIEKIKNILFKATLTITFVGFSMYLLLVKNNYYSTIAKTQFREITQHVNANNSSNDEVVSLRGWYLHYFLKPNNTKIVDQKLEDYINQIASDSTKLKSFWYLGAFGDNYNLNQANQEFINKHFEIQAEKQLFDSWAKHFVLKNNNFSQKQEQVTLVEGKEIQLLNLSDQNWNGGVSKISNMFLVSYSKELEERIKMAKKIKFSDNTTCNIIGFEIKGNYIHIFIDQKAVIFTEKAAYPNRIQLIK